MSDGEGQCPHSDVHYNLNLVTLTDTGLRYLEVTGHCKICEAPMRFRGPMGMSPNQPMVGVGGEELRAPLMFGDEEPSGPSAGFGIREATGG